MTDANFADVQNEVTRSGAFAVDVGGGTGHEVLVDDVEQLLEIERLREVVLDAGVLGIDVVAGWSRPRRARRPVCRSFAKSLRRRSRTSYPWMSVRCTSSRIRSGRYCWASSTPSTP